MLKPGDKVRVKIDTNGGYHPFVAQRGYYADTVELVNENGQVLLNRVSWAPLGDCTPTDSDDALATIKGREFRIKMLDRGKVWWAKLPGALEPLAIGDTYDHALRTAVMSLM